MHIIHYSRNAAKLRNILSWPTDKLSVLFSILRSQYAPLLVEKRHISLLMTALDFQNKQSNSRIYSTF